MICRAEAFALCHTCKLRHPCFSQAGYDDFLQRHKGHSTSYLNRDSLNEKGHSKLAAWNPIKRLISAFGDRDIIALRTALEGYAPNADVKQAFQGIQTLTVTNLHSLASSTTAGWQGAEVDNSANLYLGLQLFFVLDFANTAPANSKCVYVFAAAGGETGKLSNPFSGTEGTLTLLDVTANPQAARLVGTIPYTTQDEIVEMPFLDVFPGAMPPYWAVGAMNHSGAALAASGNTVKYRGVYATVI